MQLSQATIAAVQSQIMVLLYQDNSMHLKTVTNVLGFTGVTSACLGLLLSTLLQRHIAVVETQINAIEDASPVQLQGLILCLEATGVRAVLRHRLRDFPELFRAKSMARATSLAKQNTNDGAGSNHLTESSNLRIAAVPESLAHIKSSVTIASAVSGAMVFGVSCFFWVSALSRDIDSATRRLDYICGVNVRDDCLDSHSTTFVVSVSSMSVMHGEARFCQ
ncbi:hypothetical protein C8R45DRAFT_194704 [Mycena sanguinolenta]|nr:hypothetical protein C8R45DRAFT_194704 [Mycena sanguinolenta]